MGITGTTLTGSAAQTPAAETAAQVARAKQVQGYAAGAGSLAQVGGQLLQGFAGQRAAEYDADALAINDTIAQRQVATQISQIERDRRRLTSTAVARQGASGLDLEGSFTDVVASNNRQAELDALAARYGGTVSRTRARNAIEQQRYKSSQALPAAGLEAGTSLLTGAYRYTANGRSFGYAPANSVE